ncbi:MAG: HAMP domain-containing protein [Neisseriaceae bacterium]|nr:MAG: HAMP domain-containing protein [Neisseriaceae bacterium]
MKNLRIAAKIALLLLIPLLSVIGYTLQNVRHAHAEWQSLASTESLMDVAIALGDLTHNLQIERGATAGFVQSKGAKFATDLPTYRANTDKQLQALQALFAQAQQQGMPDKLQLTLQATFKALQQLPETRAAASGLTIPAPEAAAYFTRSIATLLDNIPAITEQTGNLTLIKRMTGYLAFLQAKERTGQERALMVPVFTADAIEAGQYRDFIGHMAAQQAYLSTFKGYMGDDILALYQANNSNTATQSVEAMRKSVIDNVATGQFGIEPTEWFKAITQKINDMRSVEAMLTQQIKTTASTLAQQAQRAMWLNGALSLLLLLAMLGLAGWMAASIINPINALRDSMVEIERNKDLTRQLAVNGKDEVAHVAEAFNRLISSVRQSVANASNSAHQVLGLAATLASTSLQVAGNAGRQSEAASAMASAVEEMTVSIDQVADHSGEARDFSSSNQHLATRGGEVILSVVQDMHSIADTVHQSSQIITDLGQQSDKIVSIVLAIKEIADQTNLLALNAAIEAARAGEQGRGFSVVADEVRKLAERTAVATQQINSMIHNIQSGTRDAVASMQVGVERVNQGVSLANQAGDAIREIQSGAQQIGTAVSDISAALKEQSIASADISRHVEQVAQMTDENNAAANSNASTARQLEQLAADLQRAVEQFRT